MMEWIALQEEMLRLQRLQLDAMRKASDAFGHSVQMQKSMADAARSNAKLWESWFGMWGGKR